MTYEPIVGRDPLRTPASGCDAPDVQFVRDGTQDEVNECPVGRPDGKVTMESGRRRKDGSILRSAAAVRHEQRISGSGRVVREPGTIARPVGFGHTFKVWLWLSAQRGHGPDADIAARAAFANPKRDERCVGREP